MTEYLPFYENSEYVELSNEQINHCIKVGLEMHKYSLENKHKHKNGWQGSERDAQYMQAIGAVCEGATCVAMGWPIKLKTEVFNVADLPHEIQVRLVSKNHYGLRVLPTDEDNWRMVGVIIVKGQERKPPYRLPGWIYANDAKRPEWQMAPNGRPPMWAVPQKHLRPLKELKNLLNADKQLTDKFVYLCGVCGNIAHYGVGVNLRNNVIGTWYCADHRPHK